MNRCKISISRCIPLLSLKSERETEQESVVAMLSCVKSEIVLLFSNNQHFCIASHKSRIRPLSFKLSCDPAIRSLLCTTRHKNVILFKNKLLDLITYFKKITLKIDSDLNTFDQKKIEI